MRWICHLVCVCVVVVQLSTALPLEPQSQETLKSIDQELGRPNSEHSDVREKRTVGVFRRIFPELSKIIDDKIQQITRVVFRVVGRAVLGGGLGGGGGGGGGDGDGDAGRRISITLPTYPPDPEDEDDTEDPSDETSESSDTSNTTEDNADNAIPDDTDNSDSSDSEKKKRSLPPVEEEGGASALSEAASEVQEVRVPFPSETNDLQAAASGEDNDEAESSQEEVSDDIDISESSESTRSKRLGVFGNLFGGASGGASAGGGSGGGSGNFLFDIIRLVAGSGQTEQQDENANAPLGAGDQPAAAPAAPAQPADDGYQAGIPGPITRLFVIANRGIANLVQDLILRLAQTSERIVNFKARLITAII